jgi:transposase-like protein
MGQILQGCARTTAAVRRAIQSSQESLITLAERYDLNPKTVAKWRKRSSVADAPMGPKPCSTVLTVEQEAAIVAFRKPTLLALDDCLYALQATIPQLTRSALHRCFQRHGISRLPDLDGAPAAKKKKFKKYPIGYFHIDLTEVRTAEGQLYLFVAVDRTSKFAFAQLVERANVETASAFLDALVEAIPCQIHTVLTDNGIQFADRPKNRQGPTALFRGHPFDRGLSPPRYRAPPHQAEPSLDQRPGRTDEPYDQGSDGAHLSLRRPCAVTRTPRHVPQCLQLCQTPQNSRRPHFLSVHLLVRAKGTGALYNQSTPPLFGTEHLRRLMPAAK